MGEHEGFRSFRPFEKAAGGGLLDRRTFLSVGTAAIGTLASGVYRDLGIPDVQSRQLRAKLAAEIMGILRRRKLSQRKAAALTGLSQPDISRLNNADLSRFTLDRLVGVLNRLDRRVDLRVEPARARRKSAKALENA